MVSLYPPGLQVAARHIKPPQRSFLHGTANGTNQERCQGRLESSGSSLESEGPVNATVYIPSTFIGLGGSVRPVCTVSKCVPRHTARAHFCLNKGDSRALLHTPGLPSDPTVLLSCQNHPEHSAHRACFYIKPLFQDQKDSYKHRKPNKVKRQGCLSSE